jgi:hypothetical protein
MVVAGGFEPPPKGLFGVCKAVRGNIGKVNSFVGIVLRVITIIKYQ